MGGVGGQDQAQSRCHPRGAGTGGRQRHWTWTAGGSGPSQQLPGNSAQKGEECSTGDKALLWWRSSKLAASETLIFPVHEKWGEVMLNSHLYAFARAPRYEARFASFSYDTWLLISNWQTAQVQYLLNKVMKLFHCTKPNTARVGNTIPLPSQQSHGLQLQNTALCRLLPLKSHDALFYES